MKVENVCHPATIIHFISKYGGISSVLFSKTFCIETYKMPQGKRMNVKSLFLCNVHLLNKII